MSKNIKIEEEGGRDGRQVERERDRETRATIIGQADDRFTNTGD